jgi:hypothetical protein
VLGKSESVTQAVAHRPTNHFAQSGYKNQNRNYYGVGKMELIKSQRFQKEYQDYQHKIEKIENLEIKAQATLLLKKLVNEVKNLDNQHQDMFAGNKVPTGLSDVRTDIISTRKKLDVLLKDYNQ